MTSITEVAIFELIEPYKLTDPDPQLAKFFATVAGWQAAQSSHCLHFFVNTLSPSEIYLITGWKNVPAHEKWIASDQNQELLVKSKRFLTVKGMVHLSLDFNTIPIDKQTIVCEKYGPRYAEEKLAQNKEEREKEAELQNGNEYQVEWVGTGRNLDPNTDGDFYKFTSCTDEWRDKIVASAAKHKEVAVLKQVNVKTWNKQG
jgi:hypothetical protein